MTTRLRSSAESHEEQPEDEEPKSSKADENDNWRSRQVAKGRADLEKREK